MLHVTHIIEIAQTLGQDRETNGTIEEAYLRKHNQTTKAHK
jgi:hypothetical protein